MSRPPVRRRQIRVGVTTIAVLSLGFVAFVVGIEWFWMIWVVGFVVVLPLVALVFDTDDADGAAPERDDPLLILRERYARGELTDEQFERKVDRLIETEELDAEIEEETATERA